MKLQNSLMPGMHPLIANLSQNAAEITFPKFWLTPNFSCVNFLSGLATKRKTHTRNRILSLVQPKILIAHLHNSVHDYIQNV